MNENKTKKSKAPLLIGLVIALVIVVVASVMMALNWQVVSNSFRKLTMSPENYSRYVLTENAKKTSSYYGALYEKHLLNGLFSKDVDASTSLSFQITDSGFEWLDDAGAFDELDFDYEDYDILSEVMSVNYSCKHSDNLSYISFGFAAGKQSLGSLEVLFDKDDQMVYTRAPEFIDDWAAMSLDDFYDDDEIDDLFMVLDGFDQVGEILITREQLESICNRYIAIACDNLEDLEVGKETLEVGDLEQKVTTITISIDDDTMVNIIVALCEELLEDKEITSIIEDIGDLDFVEEYDLLDDYEDFLDNLEDALDDVDDLEDALEDIDFEYTLYVDNKGNIIGTNYTIESDYTEIEIFAAYLISGTNFAVEVVVEEDGDEKLVLSGEGKVSGLLFSGELTLEIDGDEFEVEISDVDWLNWADGYVNGSFTISFDQFGKKIPKPLRDTAIVIDIDGKTDLYKVSLVEDKDTLIFLELATTINNDASLSTPKHTFDIVDIDDMEDYLDEMDFSDLEDLVDELEIYDFDDIVDDIKDELLWEARYGIPIETLFITEFGIPTNPWVPLMALILAEEFF